MSENNVVIKINIVKKFELDGERCEIIIGDKLAERIVNDLEIDELDDKRKSADI